MRKEILWGLVGCVIGFAVGYAIGKKKPEQKKVEEPKKELEPDTVSMPEEKIDHHEVEVQMADFKNKYASNEQVDYGSFFKSEKGEVPLRKPEEPKKAEPYTISPDEYTENEDYEEIQLTYYADGVLTDQFDRRLTYAEILEHIGGKSLDKFGEYEDDTVYVQNDNEKMIYEIVKDDRLSTEVLET